jgi:hypothetical protein
MAISLDKSLLSSGWKGCFVASVLSSLVWEGCSAAALSIPRTLNPFLALLICFCMLGNKFASNRRKGCSNLVSSCVRLGSIKKTKRVDGSSDNDTDIVPF